MKQFIREHCEQSSMVMHNIIILSPKKDKSPEVSDFPLWSNKLELAAVATKLQNV